MRRDMRPRNGLWLALVRPALPRGRVRRVRGRGRGPLPLRALKEHARPVPRWAAAVRAALPALTRLRAPRLQEAVLRRGRLRALPRDVRPRACLRQLRLRFLLSLRPVRGLPAHSHDCLRLRRHDARRGVRPRARRQRAALLAAMPRARGLPACRSHPALVSHGRLPALRPALRACTCALRPRVRRSVSRLGRRRRATHLVPALRRGRAAPLRGRPR
jgi:hypothetical protein